MGGGGLVGVEVAGKCVSKENPKSDLDLDLGFVKSVKFKYLIKAVFPVLLLMFYKNVS